MRRENVELIAQTKHLQLLRCGRWEYVHRKNSAGVVIIAALTPERHVLLVEQFRTPVDARVIELPAGLWGDLPDEPDETPQRAAERELIEETGFRADAVTEVFRGTSSAGLTDEIATFFVAFDVQRVADGGGVEGEDIQIHQVPLVEIDRWLEQKAADGCLVGARVCSGLYLLRRELERRAS